MKFRKRWLVWVLSLLATVAVLFGAATTAFAAVGAPAANKNLYDNGDGTYTLSLSVTGQAESSSTTEVTKANVILVLDTSTSMVNNNTRYNGQTMSRLNAEKRVLTDDGGIIDSLLAQNVPGDQIKSDIIEVAIVNFGTRGTRAQDFTTNAATLKSTVNGLSASQGTNWQEGLMRAEEYADAIKTAQPNEEVYIIFLTDGEPTTHYNDYSVNVNYAQEWAEADDNARALVTDGYHFYGIFTWGSGNSSHYLSSLVQYAYTGSGNSNTPLDPAYAQYFTDATDTDALIEALNQITHDITQSVGFTNVELEDGVTSMTTSNVKTSVSGDVTGVKYYRSGGSYGTADPDNGQYGTEWAEAPHATVNEDGEVDWNLGDIVLEDGVTYTCTFVVWPSQESLDLVADLNNGIVDYDSLTPAQKSQISVSGGKYFLKTNTDYPTVTYSTVTTTIVDGEETTVVSQPQTATIINPDPVGLAEEKLNALKEWDDTLDNSQREEIEDVTLYLMVDGKYYYINEDGTPMGVTLDETTDWTETDYIAIAPGLMVTEDSPAYDPSAPHYTFEGTTWAMLETGHEYVFEEEASNIHFELTAYTHHPMIMGTDASGNPVIKDVVFTKDASGNITGIESVSDLGDNLSATNTLKPGINIQKKVVDDSGEEITACADPFKVTIYLVDEEGNALPTKTTADDQSYTIDYRIYYGENNPDKGDWNEQWQSYGRSDHIYKTGTSFTETLYVGDVIRVVNVETDAVYRVEESDATGYELADTTYEITYGSADDYAEYDSDATVSIDGEDYYPVEGNSAARVTLTNKYIYGELDITKTVEVADDSGLTVNTDKEFTFTVKLSEGSANPATAGAEAIIDAGEAIMADATGEGEATTASAFAGTYTYDIYDAEGNVVGESQTLTINENGEGTLTLKHGQTAKIADLPANATYTVTEQQEAGYTTTSDGATGTIPKDSAAEAKFTNTYSVTPTTITLAASKTLAADEGLNAPDVSGKYTFTLKEGNEAIDTKTNPDGKGTAVNFDEITYTAPGTYTYTVTESGEVDGVTNGTASYDVTVTVTDDGKGNLSAAVTSGSQTTAFTNTYSVTPTTITLAASKTLAADEGLNAPDVSGKYTFTLKEGNEAIDTKTNPDGKGTAVNFDEITYTAPGEHQYTVTESGEVDGVTNGQDSYTVKVNVSDQGDGTLKAEVTEGSQVTAFTNTYKVNPTKANFEVLKEIKGTPLTAGAFEFELKDAEDKLIETKTNDADGKVTFSEIDFDKPGTFTYTITEVNGGSKIDGTTYSGETVTVTVDVTDNGEGELVAEVTYDPEKPTFKNTYEADGDVELSVSKELTGRKLEDGQFTFELVDEDGNVIQTKTNNASGAVQFDSIPYNQDDFDDQATSDEATTEDSSTDDSATDETEGEATGGQSEATTDEASEGEAGDATTGDATTGDATADEAGAAADEAETDEAADAERTATFTYTIREVNDGAAGYTYDTHEVNVTVTVTDNGDGTLTAVPSYTGKTTFVNTYEAYGEAQFYGTKTVEGTELAEGQFTFQLKDDKGEVLSEATNDADGNFRFDVVEYAQNADQTDADTGTFKYTIVEVNDGQTGYTYDSHVCDVTVTVTDSGHGSLSTEVAYSDGDKATFNNPYKPLATSAPVTAKKVLEGRDLKAGEFTFELRDAEGKVVATATNAASGLVDFGYVSFDEVGTYTFTAAEVKGSDANVTYDASVYTFTVEVVDDNGQLVATVTCNNPDGAKFVNIYTKEDVPPKKKVPHKKIIPQTGDDTPTGAMALMTVFGAAALTAGTVLKRKRK